MDVKLMDKRVDCTRFYKVCRSQATLLESLLSYLWLNFLKITHMYGLKTTSSHLSTQFLRTWECFGTEVLDQSLQKVKALTGSRGSASMQLYSQHCGQERGVLVMYRSQQGSPSIPVHSDGYPPERTI